MENLPKFHQRPLEFRAWHIENEQLFNVFGFSDDLVIEQDTFYCWPRNECILMQFTGLYDSQGKKVFEGDVIYSYYEGDKLNPSTEYWRIIVYREGCFCELQHPDEETTVYNLEPTNCEQDTVVGCHYARPDLLALNTESGLLPESFPDLTMELPVIT